MVKKAYAGVVVSDLERARVWYSAVFERDADANPMVDFMTMTVRDPDGNLVTFLQLN